MNILCQRRKTKKGVTIGDLSVNGEPYCFTLEDEVREIKGVPVEKWKILGETAIPEGKYKLTWDYSEKFKRKMMSLNSVPGFSGIRVHSGNKIEDTEGCPLLGDGVQELMVEGISIMGGTSRKAVERLEVMVQGALLCGEDVWWEVRNA